MGPWGESLKDSLENSNVSPSSSLLWLMWWSISVSDSDSREMDEVLGRIREVPGDLALGESVDARDW